MARISREVLHFTVVSPVSPMTQIPLARRLGRSVRVEHRQRIATAETRAGMAVDALLSTA
ncbi:hypothetical protein QRX50_25890 [Amycolatopsis carbonis]|uniref:Uncharacterized protein n=1 Tax=Amycolatopsis carbonis TaxID=715471 RepID=A0A9Y2MTK1_9PSEU|nr:hypothetical protein [Amycolatopsis sp. 2-15]WIX74994.1 hypothetical protein QRX50_25890 [Amycolatopsis sp. 2-15]